VPGLAPAGQLLLLHAYANPQASSSSLKSTAQFKQMYHIWVLSTLNSFYSQLYLVLTPALPVLLQGRWQA
jgi:hypothetical protein